jgi:hypothetical protein
MLFKTALIGSQYPRLHVDLRRALSDLEKQLKKWGLPSPTVTDASRSVAEQEELYWKREWPNLPEKEARMNARRKFSYHLVDCAADLRTADPQKALAWLEGYTWPTSELWELLVHNVGTGLHLHVAFKDIARRKAFENRDVA